MSRILGSAQHFDLQFGIWLRRSLLLIGSGLSVNVLKKVGVKPLVQGVALWFLIASMSLAAIVGFA